MKEIDKALARMVTRAPFYAAVALRLPIREDKTIPTFQTNGRSIVYNPRFADGLSDAELIGVLMHEVDHVAHLHPYRKQNRHHRKWNFATDYVINKTITDAGFKLPEGCLLDSKFDGKSEEQVYAMLPDPKEGGGGGDGADCGVGEVLSPEGDQSEQAKDIAEIKSIVAAACKIAKQMGKLPAQFENYIEEMLKPTLSWDQLLRRFFTALSNSDYSWTKPNRRYCGTSFFLPSLRSTTLGEGVLVMDTSGSMYDNECQAKLLAEIDHIWSVLRPSRVILAQADAGVADWREYHTGDEIERKVKGGGGTDFRPVFDRVEESGESPEFLLYFTDGEGRFPDEAPCYPVLWVMTTDVVPPWGEVVRMG